VGENCPVIDAISVIFIKLPKVLKSRIRPLWSPWRQQRRFRPSELIFRRVQPLFGSRSYETVSAVINVFSCFS
jgi:hypothetical protein